jgi:hypothetical protein
LTGVGLAIGLVAALALRRAMSSVLSASKLGTRPHTRLGRDARELRARTARGIVQPEGNAESGVTTLSAAAVARRSLRLDHRGC